MTRSCAKAILRELGRGGQVYYVYNRVANMDIIAGEVRRKLVPEAIVAYAHGQMNERELERHDVCVCQRRD